MTQMNRYLHLRTGSGLDCITEANRSQSRWLPGRKHGGYPVAYLAITGPQTRTEGSLIAPFAEIHLDLVGIVPLPEIVEGIAEVYPEDGALVPESRDLVLFRHVHNIFMLMCPEKIPDHKGHHQFAVEEGLADAEVGHEEGLAVTLGPDRDRNTGCSAGCGFPT